MVVYKYLDKEKYTAYKIHILNNKWVLVDSNNDEYPVNKHDFSVRVKNEVILFDCVFNAIHGRGGEDGVLQGVLESLNVPYSGSGVLASAICMDKLRTKWCLKGAGLTTPQWYTLTSEQDFDACIDQLGFPMIIKPVREGSSIGMSRVNNTGELRAGYQLAKEFDRSVYAEAWVEGDEYTVGFTRTTGNT
jgi:D-alanine--D-alanine ligase